MRLSTDDDVRFLRHDLARCQQELAQARAAQEPLAEDLAEERFRRQTLERLVERLADAIDDWLLANDRERRPLARLRRLISGSRGAHGEERRQARLLRESGLFSNAWYLTHYPDVVDSGLPPAVHYLRLGARQGYNPSPDFVTRAYLKRHPKVARSGTNPLIHYIERSGARPHDG